MNTNTPVTVEYSRPGQGVWYMADVDQMDQGDFTDDLTHALPMSVSTAAKAVERARFSPGLVAKIVDKP